MMVLLHIAAAILVASILACSALALRRFVACPVIRYRLGALTLGLMLALPIVQVSLAATMGSRERAPIVVSLADLLGASEAAPTGYFGATESAPTPASVVEQASMSRIDVVAILSWLYVCGVAAALAWTCVRLAMTARMIASATPVTDEPTLRAWTAALEGAGLRRHVNLLSSESISTPASWAIGGWAVLLPARLLLDDAKLRCVLLHELTHLSRRDHWLLIARQVIVGMYWLSPPAWLLCRAVSRDCERSCDRHVVRQTGAARTYAHALLVAATRRGMDRFTLAASMSVSSQSELTRRITMLSTNHARTPTGRQAIIASTLVLAGIAGAAASAGALPLRSTHPPEMIIMSAPTVDRDDRLLIAGQLIRGLDIKPELSLDRRSLDLTVAPVLDQPGGGFMQETVLSLEGMRLRDGRLIAEQVDMNLPENSRLSATISGQHVKLEPGESGATVSVTGGSINIIGRDGMTRISASVGASETIRSVCAVVADEYNFLLSAVDANGAAVPITVRLDLGEHEEPGEGHDGWLLLTPEDDNRYRVKFRRHLHPGAGHGHSGADEAHGSRFGGSLPGRPGGGAHAGTVHGHADAGAEVAGALNVGGHTGVLGRATGASSGHAPGGAAGHSKTHRHTGSAGAAGGEHSGSHEHADEGESGGGSGAGARDGGGTGGGGGGAGRR